MADTADLVVMRSRVVCIEDLQLYLYPLLDFPGGQSLLTTPRIAEL